MMGLKRDRKNATFVSGSPNVRLYLLLITEAEELLIMYNEGASMLKNN